MKRVVVIGGGIAGLSSAYYLAKSGHRVTILERGAEHHDCCSLGNSGIVVPSHFEPLAAPGMVAYGMRMMLRKSSPFGFKLAADPDLIRWAWIFAQSSNRANVERGAKLLRDMHMASRALHKELSEDAQDAFLFRESGLVMLCHTEKALASEFKVAEHAETLGLKVQRLTRLDVELLENGTRLRSAGGVHFLDDCRLDPRALHEWMSIQVASMGVEFRFGHRVEGFRREGGIVRAAITNHEDVEADDFVLAAGAWSGKLAGQLGFRMPLQGGKGYSMDMPVSSTPENCFILVEARIAVTPMGGKIRFGGTMEIVGDDLSVNPRRIQGLLDSIPKYMPDFQPADFKELAVWSGLRPVSADGLPYIGKPKHISNLTVATGHGMMGVSLGPVTGKFVSAIVAGQTPEIDISNLAPDRFN